MAFLRAPNWGRDARTCLVNRRSKAASVRWGYASDTVAPGGAISRRPLGRLFFSVFGLGWLLGKAWRGEAFPVPALRVIFLGQGAPGLGEPKKAPPGGRRRGCPVERETRFELATSTLARLHSTTELLPLRGAS